MKSTDFFFSLNFFQWVTLTTHLVSPATIIVVIVIIVNAPLHTQNTWKVLYSVRVCLCVRGPVQHRHRLREERQRRRERERDRQAGGEGRERPPSKAKQSFKFRNGISAQQCRLLRAAGVCFVASVRVCGGGGARRRRSCPLFLTRCAFSLIRTFLPSGRVTAERKRPRAFFSSSLVLFIVVSVYVR